MSINTLIKYYIFVLIFLGSFNIAHANLEITEIMYNPNLSGGDYDWVEIYNNGENSIDLTKYYFYADTKGISSTSTRHGITGTGLLDSKKYVILSSDSIANFKLKYNFSGVVFHSSFDISTSTETTLAITSDSTKPPADDKTYKDISDPTLGANNDGNSLQKIEGIWNESSPTPGVSNTQSDTAVTTESTSNNDNSTTISSNISTSINTNNNSSSSSTSKILSSDIGEYIITTKIISPKIITAGLPFYISSLTTTSKKETLAVGKYVWNFGDGTSSELRSQQEFEHTYNYGGEYVLSLSFFNNSFEKIPVATNRIIIKVISADITISSVGQGEDSFIELENKSNYEIDISKWIVTAGIHNFIIPSGTIILPNHKLKLSNKITGFEANDILSISVTNQTGEVVTTYPKKELIAVKNNISNINYSNNIEYPSSKKINSNTDSPVINLNDLAAQAGNLESPVSPKSAYIWFGLFGIIAIGIAVVFITRRKVIETPDYLEKEIRAEDMTIIE